MIRLRPPVLSLSGGLRRDIALLALVLLAACRPASPESGVRIARALDGDAGHSGQNRADMAHPCVQRGPRQQVAERAPAPGPGRPAYREELPEPRQLRQIPQSRALLALGEVVGRHRAHGVTGETRGWVRAGAGTMSPVSEAKERGGPHPDTHREGALELRAHQVVR